MTLRASRLRQLENSNLSADSRAELRCEFAKEFEDQGKYEEARAVLGDLWKHIGQHPNVEGLQPSAAAEVLLRAGVLTSALATKHQVKDAQETAKNLLTESLTAFKSLSYKKKIAEAQTELALCYWRTGEYNEARDLLRETLSSLTADSQLKAKTVVRLAIVELEVPRYAEALSILTEHANLFQKINHQTLKGSYHVTLGNILENLWELENRSDYVDRALIEYAAASYHFEEAGHKCYRANVENNLGFLYFKIKRFKDAHAHLDHARRILTTLKDFGTIAQVDETRARVFIKQKRYPEAEQLLRSAIRTLEKSDRQLLLVEALITHGIAFARLRNYSAALATFRRAIDMAQKVGNHTKAADAALTAFEEISEHLASDETRTLPEGHNLTEEVTKYEHEMIKDALDISRGQITLAARRLGISYQSLGYMLETRHRDLLATRTPARKRKPPKRSNVS